MLGRQLGIYLDDSDVEHLLDEVRSEWECVLIDVAYEDSAVTELASASDVPLKSYFCLKKDLAVLRFRQLAQNHQVLDTRNNPLIEWWVPPERAGVLRPGRLSYEPKTVFGDAVQDKSKEFLEFAQGVFALARKLAPKLEVDWGKVHVGQSARRRLEGADLSLAMNG